jgi:hypothetical protein
MTKKRAVEDGPAAKKNQQVPLSTKEQTNLEDLMARYQDAVVTRNRKLGQRRSANILPTEVMRAGLLALNELTPDRLRTLVLRVRSGQATDEPSQLTAPSPR